MRKYIMHVIYVYIIHILSVYIVYYMHVWCMLIYLYNTYHIHVYIFIKNPYWMCCEEFTWSCRSLYFSFSNWNTQSIQGEVSLWNTYKLLSNLYKLQVRTFYKKLLSWLGVMYSNTFKLHLSRDERSRKGSSYKH